jgi:PPOX class probable F420-dependent enzyme
VTLNDLPAWAAALLETIPVAHLGLLDEDENPRVQPITFARLHGTIVSAIDDKPKRRPPARIQRLRHHPRAALTIDHYDDDWAKLAWVQILGDVTFLEVHDGALRALQDRYPVYRAQPPRGPFMELTPVRVLCWRATS